MKVFAQFQIARNITTIRVQQYGNFEEPARPSTLDLRPSISILIPTVQYMQLWGLTRVVDYVQKKLEISQIL